jgi:hypothetical protein
MAAGIWLADDHHDLLPQQARFLNDLTPCVGIDGAAEQSHLLFEIAKPRQPPGMRGRDRLLGVGEIPFRELEVLRGQLAAFLAREIQQADLHIIKFVTVEALADRRQFDLGGDFLSLAHRPVDYDWITPPERLCFRQIGRVNPEFPDHLIEVRIQDIGIVQLIELDPDRTGAARP